MAIRKIREIKANIPTSSMADIAFLLIVFFMVTTKFDVDRTRVSLPKSSVRAEVEKGSAYIVIWENAGIYGFKFSNGEDMSQDMPDLSILESAVAQVAAGDPTLPFVIKAQATTPYQNIDDVLDMLRQAGVEKVYLLTEQRTVEDE